MPKFYHVSAAENIDSILKTGLRTNQCGRNAYGFDFNYPEKFKQEVIHLTSTLEAAQDYVELNMFCDQGIGTIRKYEILEINFNPTDQDLMPDPEDSTAVMCKTDIPPSFIARYQATKPMPLLFFRNKDQNWEVRDLSSTASTDDDVSMDSSDSEPESPRNR